MNLFQRGKAALNLIVCSGFVFCFCTCDNTPDPAPVKSDDFETSPESFPVTPGIIDEASGIAPGRSMKGYLWTLQDSGQPHSLYLLSGNATTIKEYDLPGTNNHDWEDIATGPGPETGINYIYVADIGNNNAPLTSSNIIYRIPEINQEGEFFSQNKLEKITFTYPDGPRDAEALLLDPVTKDLFVISKETSSTGIYRLPFPQSTTNVIQAEKVGVVPSMLLVTAGDVSPSGDEILIRTYLMVYHWRKKSGESIGQTLTRAADKQFLVAAEPQGEGICFDADAKGFFTLSEKANAASVKLNYYKRK
ncbi:hypothetical protein DYBT9275_03823 [Dyadobacter sp. CECT 9275]|uniref:PE-PGRS family protein n=1 Tax=Dyadobacter helix TaxID=2822344 RepID=A0A916NCS8_9BACT|nr:PE-PGRS family protein [Dyadobacter sp. CECT 9275]CAG5006457.1 hypothetical protein DYBT9275_03823 [Dyadobacter sp. CECT 9275]